MSAHDLTLPPPGLDDIVSAADGPGVRWGQLRGEPVVVKVATGAARSALRREAEVHLHLQQHAVPGVVQLRHLVDDERVTALVLADGGHRTLAAIDEMSAVQVARSVQRTAHAIHELHSRGWTHGRLTSDHVVASTRGGVRLCSLGAARHDAGSDAVAADVAALLDLVDGVGAELERRGDRAVARRLRRVARAMRRHEGASALEVADALNARHRWAALPRRSLPQRSRSRGARPRREPHGRSAIRAGIVAVVSLGVAAAGLAAWSKSGEDAGAASRTSVRPTQRPPGPDSRASDPTGTAPAIVLDGRAYRLGVPGDQVAAADPGCGDAAVWLLRPSTGELFRFDALPIDGHRVQGRHVRTLPAPASLHIRQSPQRPGCPTLVTVDADGNEAAIP